MGRKIIPFDYAVKFLLKNPDDYEILEEFISVILKKFKYPPIKIVQLMDTEMLKDRDWLKTSIVDVLVKTEDNQYFIIEIDQAYTQRYLEKADYVASRFKSDGVSKNEKYDIKKVIHINLLFTNNPNCKHMCYHLTTRIDACAQHSDEIEYDTKEPVIQRVIDNAFSEYFIIYLKKSDNKVHDELDEWVYMLLNDQLENDFVMKVKDKVQNRLDDLKMSREDRIAMEIFYDEMRKQNDQIEYAKNEAREEGKAEGKIEGKAEGKIEGKTENMREIIQKMRAKNQSDDMICTMFDLTLDDLKKFTN